jgi:hypothetical protein
MLKGFLNRLMSKKQGHPSSAQFTLELGEIIDRIPAHMLKDGLPDRNRRIFFKMSDLTSCLATGKETIPLSLIAGSCPEIFRKEISPGDDVEILFPWARLLEAIKQQH